MELHSINSLSLCRLDELKVEEGECGGSARTGPPPPTSEPQYAAPPDSPLPVTDDVPDTKTDYEALEEDGNNEGDEGDEGGEGDEGDEGNEGNEGDEGEDGDADAGEGGDEGDEGNEGDEGEYVALALDLPF